MWNWVKNNVKATLVVVVLGVTLAVGFSQKGCSVTTDPPIPGVTGTAAGGSGPAK